MYIHTYIRACVRACVRTCVRACVYQQYNLCAMYIMYKSAIHIENEFESINPMCYVLKLP